jgi:NAD(P)-dependent dehydrogenase (short-subunit alcohol dehydrogenase family)
VNVIKSVGAKMNMFVDKAAPVTGGSSGRGEARALKFAEQCAKVVIAALLSKASWLLS